MVRNLLEKHKPIFWVILISFGLRLSFSLSLGLGVDEAHYALYGVHLDWSYFDHPPLVGWIHAFFQFLFGVGELTTRLPALLSGVVATVMIYAWIYQLSGSVQIATLCGMAISSSFLINVLFFSFLPETLLIVLAIPLIKVAVQVVEQPRRLRLWAVLGLLLGLSGLSKYTAVVWVPALIMFWWVESRGRLVRAPGLWVAAAVSLVLVSPVIYWNAIHDFASFRYQLNHVVSDSGFSAKPFLRSRLAEFLSYSPFLFPFAIWGWVRSRNSLDRSVRAAFWLGLMAYGFFVYTSLRSSGLPHWTATFFYLFIPYGVYCGLESQKRSIAGVTRFSVWATSFVAVFAVVFSVFRPIAFPEFKSPFFDLLGYPDAIARSSQILNGDPSPRQKALAVPHWVMMSRTSYYGRKLGVPVYLVDSARTQFDFWQKESPLGKDLLVLSNHFYFINVKDKLKCDEIQKASDLEVRSAGGLVDRFEWSWCRNYQGLR